MELRDLRCFVVVYDTNSFTRAAATLNTTQSNVSARIRRLERFLGATLSVRLHRSIVPTAKGERLYRYATDVIERADQIAGAIQNDDEAA